MPPPNVFVYVALLYRSVGTEGAFERTLSRVRPYVPSQRVPGCGAVGAYRAYMGAVGGHLGHICPPRVMLRAPRAVWGAEGLGGGGEARGQALRKAFPRPPRQVWALQLQRKQKAPVSCRRPDLAPRGAGGGGPRGVGEPRWTAGWGDEDQGGPQGDGHQWNRMGEQMGTGGEDLGEEKTRGRQGDHGSYQGTTGEAGVTQGRKRPLAGGTRRRVG